MEPLIPGKFLKNWYLEFYRGCQRAKWPTAVCTWKIDGGASGGSAGEGKHNGVRWSAAF